MSEEATPSAGSPDVAEAAPAVSFLDSLPEDLRGEPSLRNFNDVGALAKSYTHAQRMIGGDKIGKPSQSATKVSRNLDSNTARLLTSAWKWQWVPQGKCLARR
jgi:hypothetical protein